MVTNDGGENPLRRSSPEVGDYIFGWAPPPTVFPGVSSMLV
jgi:hypothetical protein